MGLDPAMRQQLIEARERIKAQLINDECATRLSCSEGGPPDFRGVTAELKDELQQIDEMLGIDPDHDDHEPGDEDLEAVAAAAANATDYDPVTVADANANFLASKVVVDDASTWGFSRVILLVAALLIGIAVALSLVR